ncbi:VOC family protein [Alienimonas sp. DA493]|uniref:VOC family protein n=1 Tax=Alienimonas sp. DA493 TaxID=3373605 RepID=UPI003754C497
MSRPPVFRLLTAALLACCAPLAAAAPQDGDQNGEKDAGPYSKPTIDVGVIVSDAEKTETFYVDVLGFEKSGEFSVDEQIAGDSGLTDDRPLHARVMTLGKGEDATRIKLVTVPGAPPARQDSRFIHSTYGPSYLTLHVRDMDPILKAAAEHKLKPLAKGPVALGGGRYLALLRDPDGNFIELVGARPHAQPEEPAGEEKNEDTQDAAKPDGEQKEEMKSDAKKDEPKKDEPKKDEPKNDEASPDEPAEDAADDAEAAAEKAGDAAENAAEVVEEAAEDATEE